MPPSPPAQTSGERMVRIVTLCVVIAIVVGGLVAAGVWAWQSDASRRPTATTSATTKHAPGGKETGGEETGEDDGTEEGEEPGVEEPYDPNGGPVEPGEETGEDTGQEPPRTHEPPVEPGTVPGQNNIRHMLVPPSAGCAAALPPIPLDPASEAGIQPVLDCLVATWGPEYQRVMGATLPPPRLEVAHRKTATPCGTARDNSYYCARNQTIYLRADAFKDGAGSLSSVRLSMLCLLARELGHHVQQMSGVWRAFEADWTAASEDMRPELRRRLELQSDCFAGMVMRAYQGSYAITDADLADLAAMRDDLGDEEHGSPESQVYWQHTGWEHQSMAMCNTWEVEGDLVS